MIILYTDMSIASHNMYSAVKDAYEANWLGSSDVVSAVDVCWIYTSFLSLFQTAYCGMWRKSQMCLKI